MIHARLLHAAIIFMSVLFTSPATAQKVVLPNAYAHNDYFHKRPLLDALENGFTYVEADIFLRGDKLVVAHFLPTRKSKTLEELYLLPLLKHFEKKEKDQHQTATYPITVMIDIKSNGDKTYRVLELLLQKYHSILSRHQNGAVVVGNVTVVLTGNKPYDLINGKDSGYAFIDDDLKHPENDTAKFISPIASCKYSSIIKWKGKGQLPEKQKQQLEYYVSQAHLQGRKVRLWASPENKAVWTELLKCNVDLINTNKLVALKNFLIAEMSLTATNLK